MHTTYVTEYKIADDDGLVLVRAVRKGTSDSWAVYATLPEFVMNADVELEARPKLAQLVADVDTGAIDEFIQELAENVAGLWYDARHLVP